MIRSFCGAPVASRRVCTTDISKPHSRCSSPPATCSQTTPGGAPNKRGWRYVNLFISTNISPRAFTISTRTEMTTVNINSPLCSPGSSLLHRFHLQPPQVEPNEEHHRGTHSHPREETCCNCLHGKLVTSF